MSTPFSFVPVAPDRSLQKKPRTTGRTMIIDDGMPVGAQRDLLEAGGRFVSTFEPSQLMFEFPGPWLEGVCHHQIETLSKLLVHERGSGVNLGNVAP